MFKLQKALKEVENVFLNRGQRFIASDAEPTLADLWCFSELKVPSLFNCSSILMLVSFIMMIATWTDSLSV